MGVILIVTMLKIVANAHFMNGSNCLRRIMTMARKKKEMDKLAWENAQALAAGMSYGKWKAMQEPVKIVKEKELPEGWCRCAWCNTPFKPKTKRPRKYCESRCQQIAWNSKRPARYNAEYQRQYRERKKAEANG